MSKPDLSKVFSYPTYGYKLRVTITENVGATARKIYPDLPVNQTTGIIEAIHVVKDCCNTAHIVIPYEAGINCIVHECSHFVWWLMDQIGAQLENEVVAYHLGYTVERVCEWIAKVEPMDIVEKKSETEVDKLASL